MSRIKLLADSSSVAGDASVDMGEGPSAKALVARWDAQTGVPVPFGHGDTVVSCSRAWSEGGRPVVLISAPSFKGAVVVACLRLTDGSNVRRRGRRLVLADGASHSSRVDYSLIGGDGILAQRLRSSTVAAGRLA